MNRRTFLGMTGALALAGCTGSESTSETNETQEVPQDAQSVANLAGAFLEAVQEHYPDARVFVSKDGEIAVDYPSNQDSGDGVQREFHQLADLYVEVVQGGEYDPATLSIITSGVQAIVSRDAVIAYVEGDLKEDAFYQTIQVTDVKRTDHDHGNHDHDH